MPRVSARGLRFPRLLTGGFAALALAACGGSDGPTSPPTPDPVATTIQLSTSTVVLASIGASAQLTATVRDQNGATMSGVTVTWSSSGDSVATVSSTGLVTSVTNGSATVTATSGSLSATADVTVLQVAGSVALDPDTLVLPGPGATANVAASVLDAGGTALSDAPTLAWTSADSSIAVADSTGAVTAMAAGSTTISVRVTGSDGASSGELVVTVNPALQITTASLVNAAPTVAYDETLEAAGGDGTQTWTVTVGTLPAGLSLDGVTGAITGVPTGPSQTFTVQATSGDGQTADVELTITVNPVLAITTTTLADGDRSVAYADALTATGGSGAGYTWSLTTGVLPRGLALGTDGSISGTPVGGEVQAFTVRVDAADGQTAEQALSLTINGPAVLLPTERCSDYPSDAVATFADSGLEDVVRNALAIGPTDDITCTGLAGIGGINAEQSGVTDLDGVQNLVGITDLNLFQNQITDLGPLSTLTNLSILTLTDNPAADVGPLSGLTGLEQLRLGGMGITDLTPLSGLTALTLLWLEGNLFTDITPLASLTALEEIFLFTTSITDVSALQNLNALSNVQLFDVPGLSDIQPLIDNTGLGAGDTVNLTNVSPSLPCADVTALQAKGVTVTYTSCSS